MKRVLALLFILAVARAADDKPRPEIRATEFPAPPAPRAACTSLATAPDGALWLSWVERSPTAASKPAAAPSDHAGHHEPGPATPAEVNTLRCSRLDPATKTWSAPHTIASDTSITTNILDVPQLAITPAGAVALWTDGHGGARLSRSTDRGATWSAPDAFVPSGNGVEKFSLAVLADGRVLIAWLDNRAKKTGENMQQLRARVLGDDSSERLVDPSVCDCCQTTLTAFPDGGALLAYRGRTTEEVRDIRVARFRGQTWDKPRPLNNDNWKINACPVNGPRLANDRGRVAAAWFTAADNDPRVLATYSPDAGARFLQPLRLDRGAPLGRVDTTILRDGALLVTWTEKDGSLWLRRVSPDFATDEPVELASASAGHVNGFARLALLRDYAGGQSPAQCVVAYVREDTPATLHTLLVDVPEGELLTLGKDCDCAPTAEQLLGLPLRGKVAALETGALMVQHGEIPGVLPAGTHRFQAAPEVVSAAAVGREFFARAESRDGAWHLFDVRLLAVPQ